MNTEVGIAKTLLDVGVATFRPDEPFRYTSGLLSPIYMDHRVLISYPVERKKIAKALGVMIRDNYPRVEALAGTATAGITWAAWLAEAFNLPMVYVRDKPKKHGQKNQVEGVLKPGAKTVIVEDLITTGGSALGSVEAVRKAGAQPIAVAGIYSYQMEQSVNAFRHAEVPLHTLTNFRTLVDTAVRTGILSENAQESVLSWAADPAGWGNTMGFE